MKMIDVKSEMLPMESFYKPTNEIARHSNHLASLRFKQSYRQLSKNVVQRLICEYSTRDSMMEPFDMYPPIGPKLKWNTPTRDKWNLPTRIGRNESLILLPQVKDFHKDKDTLADTKNGVHQKGGLLKWFIYTLQDIKKSPDVFRNRLGQILSATSKCTAKWFSVMTPFLMIIADAYFKSWKMDPFQVTFDEFLGMEEITAKFQELVYGLEGKGDYNMIQEKLPDAILLSGPAKTGKTNLVHALAWKTKVSFFPVSGKEIILFKKDMGAKEIRSIFIQARAYSPSLVYIEDVDVLPKEAKAQTLDITLSREILEKISVKKLDEKGRRELLGLYLKDVLRKEGRDNICKFLARETEGFDATELKYIADASHRRALEKGNKQATRADVVVVLQNYKKGRRKDRAN